MADIMLVRPSAGQTAVIPSAPDARMVLDFSADQVSIERPQGSDSLFFRFDDGAAIELQNFYTQYNKDDIPSFEVDGQLIAGTDFFNAFGPDLAPAAGPSASPTRSGRYSDFANAGLENGVNHLDGLDYRLGFGGDTQPNINPYASPFLTNAAPTLSTGGAAIAIGLTERAWSGTGDNAAPDSQRGSFSVADPDGDSLTTTVSMGGKVVAVSTAGPTTVESDYGTLVITPRGGGSNITFEYTYTLKQDPYSPTDSLAEGEKQADSIVFSISDGKGHTVTQPINVVITGSNDAPDITGVQNGVVKDDGFYGTKGDYATGVIGSDERDSITNSGTGDGETLLSVSGAITAIDPDHGDRLTFGFTEKVGSVLGTTPGGEEIKITDVTETSDTLTIKTDYGTLTLTTTGEHAGEYTFTLNNSSDATDALSERDSVTLTLHPTVSDLLGVTDSSTSVRTGGSVGSLELTIKGSNNLPSVTGNSWASTPGEITEDTLGAYKISGTIEGHDVDHGEAATLHYGFALNGKMESTLYVAPVFGTDGVQLTEDGHPKYELTTNLNGSANYYGTLTISGSGASATYTFELNNSADCVQALDDNHTDGSNTTWNSLSVTVPVVVMDKAGGYVQQDIHLDIKGTNDAPVFTSGNATHSVKEEGVYSDKFQAGSKVLYSAENTTMTTDPNDKDNANGLAGKSDIEQYHELTVTGTVAAKDVDGHGASDTLKYSLENAGKQDGTSTIYVTATYAKGVWTAGYTKTEPVSTDSNYDSYLGKLTMDPKTGEYTFTLVNADKDSNTTNSAANRMGEGATLDLTFTPAVHDATGYNVQDSSVPTIKITVNGSNEAPTIETYTSALEVTESAFNGAPGTPTMTGTVVAHDADEGDTKTYGLALGGAAGDLNGATLHNTLFVVGKYDTDGNAVLDKNGDPVLEFSTSEVEGKTYGTLTMVTTGEGAGSYTFTLKNDSPVVQKMDTGDKRELSFNVAVVDNHGAYDYRSVSLTINGANDAPYDLTKGMGTVKDNGVYDGTGISASTLNAAELTQVKSTDADSPGLGQFKQSVGGTISAKDYEGDALTYTLTGAFKDFPTKDVPDGYHSGNSTFITNDYGTLYLKSSGEYTFVLKMDSPTVDALGEGKSADTSFKVTVSDGNASTNFTGAITITVKGTNDAPVLETPEWNKVGGNEQSEITQNVENPSTATKISGTVKGNDVDADDKNNLEFFFVAGASGTDASGNVTTPIATTLFVNLDGTASTEQPKGDYLGTLDMKSSGDTGTYTFTLNNSSPTVKAMGTENKTEIPFKIAVRDPQGAYDTKFATVNLTIKGGDDPTVIDTGVLGVQHDLIEAGVQPKSVVTDAQAKTYADNSPGIPTAEGRLYATDVDKDDQKQLDAAGVNATLRYIIKDSGGNEYNLNTLMDGKSGTESIKIDLAHGSLLITRNYDGGFDYKYTVYNTDTTVQKMNLGDKTSDGFTLLIRDTDNPTSKEPKGAIKSEANVNFTIRGANDRPTVDVESLKGGIDEDASGKRDVGQVTVADWEQKVGHGVNGKDYDTVNTNFTFSLVKGDTSADYTSDSPVMQGTYGRLIIDHATGKYTYERTADLTSLAKDATVTDTFYVRVKDAHGAYSEIKPITITITGNDDLGHLTNNTPTITEAGVEGSVQGVLHWQGDKEKLGANESVGNDSMSGKLGWDDPDKGVEGATKADTYKTDGYTYGTAIISSESVTAPDIERAGDVYTIGNYGTITVDAEGTYTFAKNTTSNAFDALQAGESITVTIPVTLASDTAGEDITQNLVITIKGTNDAPVVDITQGKFSIDGYTNSFTGDEHSHAQFTGSISGDTAIDYLVTHQDMLQKYVEQEAKEIIDNLKKSRVAWWISLVGEDNATDALVDMANGVNGFLSTLGALDDILKLAGRADDITSFLKGQLAGHTIVVDSDETAAWSNSHGGDVVVRGMLNTKGIVSDVDHGAKLSFFALEEDNAKNPTGNVTQSIKGEYGTLVIHSDGSYQYVLDFNGQAYKDFVSQHPIGGLASENFKVYVRDENNAVADKPIELVINVNAPSIGWDGNGSVGNLDITSIDNVKVQEDGTKFASGSVLTNHGSAQPQYDSGLCLTGKYTTIDAAGTTTSHAASNVSSIPTEYGTITLLPDGSYTYTLNNDSSVVQQLGAGDTIKQTFEITNGSVPKEITVIIAGTNDKPYLVTNSDAVALKQNSGSWDYTDPHGSFTVNDVDKGEQAQLKPSAQALLMPSDKDSFSDKAGDVTIDGESFAYQYSVNGSHGGTFYIAEGSEIGKFEYRYVADRSGSTNYRGDVSDSATLIVSNGDGQENQIQVTLSANLDYANDAPEFITDAKGNIILAGSSVHAVIEDDSKHMVAVGTVKGTATDTDVTSSGAKDADNLSFSIKGDSGSGMQDYIDENGEKLGTLIMDKNGSYEFHLNTSSPAVQQLGAGDEKDIFFTIQVSDNHGRVGEAKLPITITGSNDAPVISLHHVTIGNDGSEVLGAAGSGEYASLTHNDISKSYTVGGELRLADADAKDNVQFTLAVEIGGAKADSVVSSGTSDTALTIYAYKDGSGKWTQCASDHVGKVTMGQLVLADTGNSHSGSAAYKFVGDKDGLAHINKGETLDIAATITAEDYHNGNKNGTSSSAEFTVSITGTNSMPVFTTQPSTASVTEDKVQSFTGSAVATDADSGEKLSYSLQYVTKVEGEDKVIITGTTVETAYGKISINDNGSYTYTLDNDNATVQALGGAGVLTETIQVTVTDEHYATSTKDIVVTIHGNNDAPVAHDYTNANWTGQLVASDLDNDPLHYSYVTDTNAHFGTLAVTDDGSYTYHLNIDADSLKNLSESGVQNDAFTYRVTDSADGSGLYDTGTISINLNGGTLGDGGQLLFAQENLTTHNYEASGGAGNDILIGGSHDDILYGGSGDDILYGGTGHNELHGEGGNDTLYAGNDGDHLYGGAGNDHLYGGTGNDFLDGGANTFTNDLGGNHLYGGVGNDVLVFHQGDTIDGGGDLDMVIVGDGGTVDTLLNGGVNGADSNVKNVEVLVSGDKAGDITSLTDLANKGLSLSKGKDGNIHVDASTDHNWSVATGSHTDAASNTFTTYTHTDSNGAVDLTVAVETLKNTNG